MKYITIKDIARHLSISVSTVSRALGDDKNIRKETKEKVIEAAKRLGYRPNPVAINLKYGHTNTVGVIVPEMVTPFASRVINGIQEVLHTKNIKVIIAESGGDPEKEKENATRWTFCWTGWWTASSSAFAVIKGTRRNIPVCSKRECLWCSMIVFPMDLKSRR